MLTIRLTRKGKKNQPFFRVVVIDKRRSSKGGRPAEILGYVDPLTKRKDLKKDRILYWISKGAQPSATIHNLLVAEKIIEGSKVKKFSVSKKAKAEAAKAAAPAVAGAELATPATEAPTPEAPKEAEKPKAGEKTEEKAPEAKKTT